MLVLVLLLIQQCVLDVAAEALTTQGLPTQVCESGSPHTTALLAAKVTAKVTESVAF